MSVVKEVDLPGEDKRGTLVDPGANGNSCAFRALSYCLIGQHGYTSLLRACAGVFCVHYMSKRVAEAKVSVGVTGDEDDLAFEDDVLFADTYLARHVEDCVTPGHMIEALALQAICDAMGWCYYLRVDDGEWRLYQPLEPCVNSDSPFYLIYNTESVHYTLVDDGTGPLITDGSRVRKLVVSLVDKVEQLRGINATTYSPVTRGAASAEGGL